tara:strand:- start:1770 stop:1901 length:132 start_codon:yes stop_codon:yes gene_type:complete
MDITFVFQVPYALMIGAEAYVTKEKEIDGIAFHFLVFTVELRW